MDWIRENWFFLIFFILFIAMHLFGHGMHGGHREETPMFVPKMGR